MMQYIAEHTPQTGRQKKPYVQGCVKHLKKLPKTTFPIASILDKAVQQALQAGQKCWHYADVNSI